MKYWIWAILAIGWLGAAAAWADDWVYWPSSAFEEKAAPTPGQLGGPPCLAARFAVSLAPRPPPCRPVDYENWLADAQSMREEHRIRFGIDPSLYESGALRWAQSSFIQPQMMVHDRYFYDPVTRRYTVDRYLDDLGKRYGGIDSVLIWPTYPNMGIDDRNQHDLIRSMPGGIEGVKQMVADFHRRNVRVFFPMMMWDKGTRDQGVAWPDAIAKLALELDADGINGDTQTAAPRVFVEASVKLQHPLVFEPEIGALMPDEALSYNLMSWKGFGYGYPFVPQIDRDKWLESRHMVNISDRWKRDKTDNLQFAFFNGVGWVSWENIWGIWNGITARDAEATRRMATIERAVAKFLVSVNWVPFSPMIRDGVYASRWPLGEEAVWTIVNRNDYDITGPELDVPADPGLRYFDLYHGVELKPRGHDGDRVLSFDIDRRGFAAIFVTKKEPDKAITDLMARMKVMTRDPLVKFSNQWTVLPQTMAPISAMQPASSQPPNMIKIPAADFLFKVEGLEIEGANDAGVDVQYPWENSARRFHEFRMQIKSFWIDKYPVTNAEFKQFLEATRYKPKDSLNFLRDWRNGTLPGGLGGQAGYLDIQRRRSGLRFLGR